MMSGLAQVIQRMSLSTPVRYLTEEIADSFSMIASRYQELANTSR
jgi:hypothetical protein